MTDANRTEDPKSKAPSRKITLRRDVIEWLRSQDPDRVFGTDCDTCPLSEFSDTHVGLEAYGGSWEIPLPKWAKKFAMKITLRDKATTAREAIRMLENLG